MNHYIVKIKAEDDSGHIAAGVACVLGDENRVDDMLKQHLAAKRLSVVFSDAPQALRDIQRNGELTAGISAVAKSATRKCPVSYQMFPNGEFEKAARTPWYPALPALLVINCIRSPGAFKKICEERMEFVTITSFFDRWLSAHYPATIGVPIKTWSSTLSEIVGLAASHYFVSPLPEDFSKPSGPTMVELIASPGFSLTDPFEPEAAKLCLQPVPTDAVEKKIHTVSELHEGTITPLGGWSIHLEFLDMSSNFDELEETRSGFLLTSACRCAIQQVYKLGRSFSGISPEMPLNIGIPVFGSESSLVSLERDVLPSTLKAVQLATKRFPQQMEYFHIRLLATAICFAVGKKSLQDADSRWEELMSLPPTNGMILEAFVTLFLSETMM